MDARFARRGTQRQRHNKNTKTGRNGLLVDAIVC
ncbi:hypothetical protein ASD8599_01346 [Ascidiaceihabitans donghaensis]|uniref:Uncharacterized protein n=1 Tax=Ascidiaceihabitans donghaensis TaxID=1510460 RepID=A0A2R8BCF2_9RHOB|nr:hypothetical protein ASD8599_01346 [Ascidiaceihabitans donghaensis]